MEERIDTYDALFEVMPKMGADGATRCVCAEGLLFYALEEGYRKNRLIEVCEAVTEVKEDSELVRFKVFPEIKKRVFSIKGL